MESTKDLNKQIILDFFTAAEQGGDMMAFLADDMLWWVPDNFVLAGTYGKHQLAPIFGQVFALLKAPPRFTIHHVTAEDDRVAVDCKSDTELLDGTPFGNTYHFLFQLRDGKIIQAKEFLNTAYMNRMLADIKPV